MATQKDPCAACGDPSEVVYKGKAYCADCGNEKQFGIIPQPHKTEPNTSMKRLNASLEDTFEGSPWGENAVRALEGDT